MYPTTYPGIYQNDNLANPQVGILLSHIRQPPGSASPEETCDTQSLLSFMVISDRVSRASEALEPGIWT